MDQSSKESPVEFDITRMSQSEITMLINELKDKVARMSSLLNEAPKTTNSGSFDIDLESQIIAWSDNNYEIFTLNKDDGELSLKKFLSSIHEADQQYASNAIKQSIQTGKSFDITYRWKSKDGRIKLINSVGSFTVDEYSGKKKIVGTNQDITETKQAIQKLQISESKLSEALKTSKLGHWEYDYRRGMFTFNDEFYALLKTDINKVGTYQLSAKEYAERFIAQEVRSEVEAAIMKAAESYESDNSFRLEQRVMFGDGTSGYLAVQFKIERNEKGEAVKVVGVNQDITERVYNEHLLKVSQEKYRDLFEANKDAISLCPFDEEEVMHNFTQVNKAACELLGYSKVEFLNLSAKEVERDLTPEKIKARIAQLLTEGAMTYEAELIHKNGSRVPAEIKTSLVEIDGKKYLMTISRDITERKKMENALRLSEDKFRVSFMMSPDAVNINRMKDGLYIEINEGFTRMTGYTLEDVKGKTSAEIAIWVNAEDRRHLVSKLRETGFCTNLEAKFRFKNGVIKTGLMSAAPIMVNGEECILSITRDITERIEAYKALSESEERYKQLFGSSPSPMLVHTNGIIVDANHSALKMFGAKTEKELIGTSFIERVHPEYRPIVLERIRQAIEKDLPAPIIEEKLLKLDGTTLISEVAATTVPLHGKLSVQVVLQDITERKKTEKSLKESEARYKSLFDLSPDAIFIHRGGKILFANKSALKLFKYPSLEEFQKITLLDLTHTDYHKIVKERIRKIKATGEAARPLYEKYICYDGTTADVEILDTELTIDGEKTFQVLARDVSERTKAERTVKLQRDMNQALISIKNLNEAVKVIFDYAQQILGVDCGGLYVTDIDGGLRIVDSFGISQKFQIYAKYHAPDSRNVKIVQSGKATFLEFDHIKQRGGEVFKEGIKTASVIPLLFEGKVAAVLNLASRSVEIFSDQYKSLIENFAIQSGAFIRRLIAEKELKENENKFRAFFEADLAGDYQSLEDGTLLECNQAFVKMLEFDSKEQALSTNMNELYPKVHKRDLFLSRLRKEKSLELIETRLVSKKGREIIVLENALADYDKNGKFIGATGYMVDVTQLKMSERALKESEKNYRELFSRMESGFAYHEIILNRNEKPVNFRFIAVNAQFEKQTGLKAAEIVGRTATEVMPQIEKHLFETYGKVALTGKPVRFENYSKDIGKYYKVVAYSPEKYKFATIIEDITETRKVEEKIRQLSLAVEQSSVIVIITNYNGIIEYVNPMFTKVTGYSFAEAIGRTPRLLKSGHVPDKVYKNLWKQIRAGKDWSGIFRNKKKNGELYWESAVISPMRDAKNRVTHFIAIKEDISEKIKKDEELENYRNQLEAEVDLRTRDLQLTNVRLSEEIVKQRNTEELLKVSLDKEKELNELKTRFISTTSHEFRTPLTSVLSSTELLQKYGKKWSEAKFGEHVDRTKRAVEYLVKLLDDVLTISRTESGKINFAPTVFDLKSFCSEIVEEATASANQSHKIIFKYNLKQKDFNLDPKLLKFVLLNLIVNALKYSPDGGEIKLIVNGDKNNINFNVSDQGIGIPDDEKPHIFDNFFRSRNSVDIPGTGLGLSIVKRSAELHRGSISFVSKINVGTTFIVSIPKTISS